MADATLVERGIGRLRLEARRLSTHVQDARRRRRNAHRVFHPIFVTGAIGSGTSLLAVSLAQRLGVAGVALESARQIDRRSPLWIDRVDAFPSVRAYAQRLEPLPDWSIERVREDLQALYRSRAVEPACDWIVDKGPNANLVRAGFLSEAFPESPFLLIFRDPVANVEGFRRKWRTFRDAPLEESMRFWSDVHERFLERTASVADRVMVIEYESLVADYEAALGRLAGSLGLERADRARPVEARAEGHGRGLRGVEGGRIRVVGDANARAYETLGPEEVDRIRAALAPLHGRLQERARESGLARAAGEAG